MLETSLTSQEVHLNQWFLTCPWTGFRWLMNSGGMDGWVNKEAHILSY
jgi:hypothetical protein